MAIKMVCMYFQVNWIRRFLSWILILYSCRPFGTFYFTSL